MQDAASEPEPTGDGAAPRIALGKGRALVPVPQPARKAEFFAGLGRSHGVVAAGVAVVMGIGFVAGTAAFAPRPQGAVLAQASPPSAPASPVPAARPADTTLDVLYRVQGEVRSLRAGLDGLRAAADDDRQGDAIRGLRKAVDVLKQEVEGVKVASAGAAGQLGAKIDKLDRDPGPKLNDLSARLEKLERAPEPKAGDGKPGDGRTADAKAADARIGQVASQLTARLDRLERQVASTDATGSIPRDAAAQAKAPLPPQRLGPPAAGPSVQAVPPTAAPQAASQLPASPQGAAPAVAALPPPRPEPVRVEASKVEPPRPDMVARAETGGPARQPDAPQKPATLDGWLLRDVYGGVALVEGRAGGLREVAPGEYVPGVGEIRSIERRGRGWVVVTSRGLIMADNRW